MKIFNNILVAAFCVATISCADLTPLENEIADLKEQIAELKARCAEMNESLEALSVAVDAVAARDYVTSVQEISDSDGTGFILTFVEHPTITIWIPNQVDADVKAPVISVKQGTDGALYWAVDGEYVLDQNGNKVPVGADGATPKLNVEDGKWLVSYDNGATWEYLANVSGSGSGGYVFDDVDLTDPSKVVLTLSDGQVVTLPVATSGIVSLSVADASQVYGPGDVIVLEYSSLKNVSVMVDDDDIKSSEVKIKDSMNGSISLVTKEDEPLYRQRAFVIMSVDGVAESDWRLVSFDSEGKVVISDIK